MRKYFMLSAGMLLCLRLISQNTTWTNGIGQMLFDNCSSCHHEGSIGPFPIMSYEVVVEASEDIRQHVLDRHMPPWPADPAYRHFKDEAALSQEEIDAIVGWIDNLMPVGTDPMPEPPVYTDTGTQLESIDFTVAIEPYTLQFETDEWRWFTVETNFEETVYINEIEIIPGLPEFVHHADLSYDLSGISTGYDNIDPLPGFNSSTGGPNYDYYINAWMAGGNLVRYPPNWGIAVPPGAVFVVEIHYGPGGQGQIDSTIMNLRFLQEPENFRPVYPGWVLNQPTGESLVIPPNEVVTFTQDVVQWNPKSLVSICPHMHMLGKSYMIWMETMEGDSIPLISIPEWDFHWQKYYTFQQVQVVPAGAHIKAIATYDNTDNNEDNPNDPPILVTYGSQTEDEMLMTFAIYANYMAGDENIVLDSTILVNYPEILAPDAGMLVVYPNPVKDFFFMDFYPLQETSVLLRLISSEGKILMEENVPTGDKKVHHKCDMSGLSPGAYILQVSSEKSTWIRHLLRQ